KADTAEGSGELERAVVFGELHGRQSFHGRRHRAEKADVAQILLARRGIAWRILEVDRRAYALEAARVDELGELRIDLVRLGVEHAVFDTQRLCVAIRGVVRLRMADDERCLEQLRVVALGDLLEIILGECDLAAVVSDVSTSAKDSDAGHGRACSRASCPESFDLMSKHPVIRASRVTLYTRLRQRRLHVDVGKENSKGP